MTDLEMKNTINQLIAYASDNLALKQEDESYVLNTLLDFFHFNAPTPQISNDYGDFQTTIIEPIVQYAIEKGMVEKENALLFETKIMGMVTPMPSQIIEEFDIIAAEGGIKAATDWLFDLCKANNYLRMVDINKNLQWHHEGSHGPIDITINLSKPEKDPKQIAAAKLLPQSGYPACMLCASNVGFAGHANHPARQTLRIIPMEIGKEAWGLQFSPYQYYEQHVIALSYEHRPMDVTPESFERLLDFVTLFPHYFIGSNAALPIVGGSILTHDHYQGGNKVLPMFAVGNKSNFSSNKYPEIKISIADWYNSVVRISGKNKATVLEMATNVLEKWKNWSDNDADVIAKTSEQHNAITPICRLESNGDYCFDLILRNNRTDAAHPFGIFHAAEDLHNIKKEGIGIIEVMGLFILPGRLKSELELIKNYLTGKTALVASDFADNNNPLSKHKNMITSLVNEFGVANSQASADTIVTDYINNACERILECTAVFKNTASGEQSFEKFMTQGLGLKKVL